MPDFMMMGRYNPATDEEFNEYTETHQNELYDLFVMVHLMQEDPAGCLAF